MRKTTPLFPNPENPDFTFIDLFAGIGGFRLAMNSVNGSCVFSSEIDPSSQKTYYANFGEVPYGDITKDSVKAHIPEKFDVLCGGFPCQAFSIAGHRRGFEDARGTLFFDVATIVKKHRPKVVFLENVKNLISHNNGETFNVIRSTLEEFGYFIYSGVFNAMDYANVPQNRERVFIVGFDIEQVPSYKEFKFPSKIELTKNIHSCIDKDQKDDKYYYTERLKIYDTLKSDMTSRDTLYQWRRQYVRENKSNVCPTLTANMGTGGHNVPLILTDYGIRKLTPKECLNFQGFPEQYQFSNDIAISKMYMEAGNSVVVPLITKVCESIKEVL